MSSGTPRDPTPSFQVVFVRRERVTEERASEGFEMVGEEQGLKCEDFPVVLRGDTPTARGR